MVTNEEDKDFINGENTRNQTRIANCRSIIVAPVYRESQSLQLCALHSMNNLLQLNPHIKNGVLSSDEDAESLILCGGDLYYHSKLKPGSKAEFNAIADQLTVHEAQWLSQTHSDRESSQTLDEKSATNPHHVGHLSYWNLLRSHHRAVFTGNYSFEVLESSLSKRNVRLEWCTGAESVLSNDSGDRKGTHEVTIGFIVNTIARLSITNAFTRVVTTPRHWFTITKLRRVSNYELYEAKVGNDITGTVVNCTQRPEETDYDSNTWHLVDSLSYKILDMNSQELEEFISDIRKDKKASIFRAVMQNLLPFQSANGSDE